MTDASELKVNILDWARYVTCRSASPEIDLQMMREENGKITVTIRGREPGGALRAVG